MKRMLSRIITACGVVFAFTALPVSAASPDKPDAAQGENLYVNGDVARGVLACVSCHGDGGNSVIPLNPNLAGQTHQYLAKQLVDFAPPANDDSKAPARGGPNGAPTVMAPFAKALTPTDIANVTYYLSQQPLDYSLAATATKQETAERGQQIWRGGIPSRGVPACAGCHSANGAGLPAEYPRLAGQFPTYIIEQLRLFRSGDRANNDVMHDIADRMSDADIAAVADYAAGLR